MANSEDGPRPRILALLQKQESVTVQQLAQDIGLAPATIRRHLDILQRDRLVSFRQVRSKPGRPEFSYFLTEDGQETGYRDYSRLLTLLLAQIKSLEPTDLAGNGGKQLLNLLILRAAENVGSSYLELGQLAQETRIDVLERALTEGGFAPEVSQEDGQVYIRLCNCPFRAAALCQKSVCLFDRNLIASILGAEPVRQATIRNGDSCCSYVATVATLDGNPLPAAAV